MRDDVIPNLVGLSPINCNRSENLPSLGQLPSLKHLKVHGMDAIKCISIGFYGYDETTKAFPSLEELEFYDLPNWEEWSAINGRELLLKLRKLAIEECSMLRTTPSILSLKDLELMSCNPTIIMSVSSLTSLSSLKISDFDQLTSFPKGMLQNSTNLSSLYILSLPELMFLGSVLDNLVALKSLCIVDCRKLASLPEGLKNLTALEKLEISICKRLISIPEEGMQGMTSFRNLSINSCANLTSLPGLQYLTALETMAITGCKEMVVLPDATKSL
ncbi:hypothetical protein MRB53_009637 [Persea americana]|uniref:Uncharacterized protein n=1 Tax=Persea americana TaxID=3435 RepID=A0ACC2LPK1_PERAE|nr:hypothetical protein MRB53_009637 [Persea americana]